MRTRILWINKDRPDEQQIAYLEDKFESSDLEVCWIKPAYDDISGSFSADVKFRSQNWLGLDDIIIRDLVSIVKNYDAIVADMGLTERKAILDKYSKEKYVLYLKPNGGFKHVAGVEVNLYDF